MYHPIRDYAIIGDSHTAALISTAGSVDWLCLPRFDSPSVFGALLDAEKGGRLQILPVGDYTARQQYVGATNVLETTFTTPGGVLRVVDAMAVAEEEEKRRLLWPGWLLIRRIECLEGEVAIEVVCEPRPDYARTTPRLRDRGPLGFCFEWKSQALALRSDLPLQKAGSRARLEGAATLKKGERRYVCITYALHDPVVLPPLGTEADTWLERTRRWWEEWISHCRYDGPYRDAVLRSALVLKLLLYAPSGALVAAPTTSLPERIGGALNWDYRYCWLRDASMMLRSLMDLGYTEEGTAFLSWLLHATQLTWPELRVVYTVYGETNLPERSLDYLEGYERSRPVRVGNEAAKQLQLDVYGEVAGAAFAYVRRGGRLDRLQARRLAMLGPAIYKLWRRPDAGIWESRAEPSHHTVSKAACWVALDHLIQLHHEGHVKLNIETAVAERDAIREMVESQGFIDQKQSYVSVLGGDEVDASLLLLGLRGYADPMAPRMRSTIHRIQEALSEDSLVYRYRRDEEGEDPHEGAFSICSFWLVESLARAGYVDEAAAHFERLLAYANDAGLYAEEIDPGTRAALGNFPQAFTHAGLVGAAMVLAEQMGRNAHEPSTTPPEDSRS
ncbi:MAG TPA: glycoside hydrolase family 15 protein [Rhodothermales bacterium]|nr:glycoside hydrolase family 15 protein [Rhodothermales bacterium]